MIGGRLAAVRPDAAPQVLAAQPARLKIGAPTEVRVVGAGLSDALTLPEGVTGRVQSVKDGVAVLELTATGAAGPVAVQLGGQAIELVAYDRPDRISISPEMAMARIGGNGGPNPERPRQTNNAGNLKVIATVTAGDKPLTAEAHLYATIQRFVDAPIR